jgi:hypothetical protein
MISIAAFTSECPARRPCEETRSKGGSSERHGVACEQIYLMWAVINAKASFFDPIPLIQFPPMTTSRIHKIPSENRSDDALNF